MLCRIQRRKWAMALSLALNKRGGSMAWGVQQTSLSQYEQPKNVG